MASVLSLFNSLTESLPSPKLFREWAGVWLVSAALRRRVWLQTAVGQVYPNLFTILLGPPAVGKSVVLTPLHNIALSAGLTLVPTRVTRAGLEDALEESIDMFTVEGQHMEAHPLAAISSELGNFIPEHDVEFLNVLNVLYDGAPSPYKARKRTGDKQTILIPNPLLAMIGGTQPKFMAKLFPKTAWGMGFMSRVIIVYESAPVPFDIFGASSWSDELQAELLQALQERMELSGQIGVTAEARDLIRKWRDDPSPVPDHPKLEEAYNPRRILHLLKLSMAFAVAESPELIINARHVEQALDLLIRTEEVMPQAFTDMTDTDYGDAIDETIAFIRSTYLRAKRPVHEAEVLRFLQGRLPVHHIEHAMDHLIRAGLVSAAGSKPGTRLLTPK